MPVPGRIFGLGSSIGLLIIEHGAYSHRTKGISSKWYASSSLVSFILFRMACQCSNGSPVRRSYNFWGGHIEMTIFAEECDVQIVMMRKDKMEDSSYTGRTMPAIGEVNSVYKCLKTREVCVIIVSTKKQIQK